jgi:DivIVA domain-containing protein
MTPDDIRSQRFGTRLLQGYSPEEVTAFLEDVADAFDEVQKTSATLVARVKHLENDLRTVAPRPAPVAPALDKAREAQAQAEIMLEAAREKQASASNHIEVLRSAALREVEALLHDAQTQAQALVESAREREAATLRDAEAAKARLRVEGEELVAAAASRADALIAAVRDEEATLHREIDRLTQSRLQLVDEIRKTLDTYHDWLGTVDPRGRALGRREAHEANGHGESVGASDEARAV